MPLDYGKYHPRWSLISRLIRFRRAHNCCEWCGIPNGIYIKRLTGDAWRVLTPLEWEGIRYFRKHSGASLVKAVRHFGFTRVILTVAHLDHNRDHNRFSNLAALCQRCHLHHDLGHHIANRKYGREHGGEQQLKIF